MAISFCTQQSWWCGRERCGKQPGGPMTELLCSLGGWVRAGMFTPKGSSSRPGQSGPGFDTCFCKHSALGWLLRAFQRVPQSQLSTWARGAPGPAHRHSRQGPGRFPTLRTCCPWAMRIKCLQLEGISGSLRNSRKAGAPVQLRQELLWKSGQSHRLPFRFYAHISPPLASPPVFLYLLNTPP